MPLKYRIVLKKDMSKGAAKGDQLYYGQIRSLEKTNFKKLCKLVSGYCTAKPGEVELVIDGLIYVLCIVYAARKRQCVRLRPLNQLQ